MPVLHEELNCYAAYGAFSNSVDYHVSKERSIKITFKDCPLLCPFWVFCLLFHEGSTSGFLQRQNYNY